eukprot:1972666-Heterocapsa_arctica.AAC.1
MKVDEDLRLEAEALLPAAKRDLAEARALVRQQLDAEDAKLELEALMKKRKEDHDAASSGGAAGGGG